jgi:hypothetical protein
MVALLRCAVLFFACTAVQALTVGASPRVITSASPLRAPVAQMGLMEWLRDMLYDNERDDRCVAVCV